jgi:hypothetical protein
MPHGKRSLTPAEGFTDFGFRKPSVFPRVYSIVWMHRTNMVALGMWTLFVSCYLSMVTTLRSCRNGSRKPWPCCGEAFTKSKRRLSMWSKGQPAPPRVILSACCSQVMGRRRICVDASGRTAYGFAGLCWGIYAINANADFPHCLLRLSTTKCRWCREGVSIAGTESSSGSSLFGKVGNWQRVMYVWVARI